MSLNALALRVLQLHAERPQEVFYGVDALPSIYRRPDLDRLDAAYLDLVAEGLIKQEEEVPFFDMIKHLYQVTERGLQRAVQEKAA